MSTKLIVLAFLFCLISVVFAGKGHGDIVLNGCGGKLIVTADKKDKDEGQIIMHENCGGSHGGDHHHFGGYDGGYGGYGF